MGARGRNEACQCGSGRKFKRCCLRDGEPRSGRCEGGCAGTLVVSVGADGIRVSDVGGVFSERELASMQEELRRGLLQSELFDELKVEFGAEGARRLISEIGLTAAGARE